MGRRSKTSGYRQYRQRKKADGKRVSSPPKTPQSQKRKFHTLQNVIPGHASGVEPKETETADPADIIPSSTKTTLSHFFAELVLEDAIMLDNIMVVGGIATVYYGRPRFSRDLDLAVALKGNREARALLSVLKESERYSVIYPDKNASRDEPELNSPEDLKKIGLVKLKDKKTNTIIDVLLIKESQLSPYSLKFDSFARAKKIRIGSDTFAIPSPEDFILMKLAARRPSTDDFQDLFTALIKNYDKLDWAYLTERAGKLGVSHILAAYRENARRRRKGSDKGN